MTDLKSRKQSLARDIALWIVVVAAIVVPLAAAGASPLLAWREPVYQLAGFAGILGFALMFMQPLLAGGYLPGLPRQKGRRLHRAIGLLLVFCVITHVIALWITSPPDVVDALLFVSATPFSVWGVIAMWAVFAAATVALLRYRLPLRVWRLAHTALVALTITGTVVHALMIEGTMETFSKVVLCALVLFAVGKTVYDLRVWAAWWRRS